MSEALWRSRFGATPDILSHAITLDGINYEVVGVMPNSMRFPTRVDGWVPLGPFVKGMPRERGNHPNLTAVGLELLTESLLLAVCGASLGGGTAWLALRVLVQSKPTSIPRIDQVGIDPGVLGFTCLLSIAVAVLTGLWPVLRITSAKAQISLRDLTRTSSGHSRLRPFLVAGEAGLATMLLIGAALMIRTFDHLTRIELGFRPEHVLTLRVSLPAQRYASPDRVSGFYRNLLRRVSALPGTTVAGISSLVPLAGAGAESSIVAEGAPMDPNNPGPGCTFGTINGAYFQVMGIPLLKGRTFDEHDSTSSTPVIVVDELAASTLWPGQDPLGKRLASFRRETIDSEPCDEDSGHTSPLHL